MMQIDEGIKCAEAGVVEAMAGTNILGAKNILRTFYEHITHSSIQKISLTD